MKKIISLLVLLVIVFGIVYIGSPYYSAYQLQQAYEAKDGATIADAIDYEQLRPNLQKQLSTKLSSTLSQYPMVAELGGEPLKNTANAFIDNSVNGAITRSNIEQLIKTQGQANQATKELAAAWAIASNQLDLKQLIQQIIIQQGDMDTVIKGQIQQMMDKQAEQLAIQVQTGEDSANPKLSYCGIDCFYIAGIVKGYPVRLEMQREGWVDWKITDVELP